VIRLTTITLRHLHAGERAPSTTPRADIVYQLVGPERPAEGSPVTERGLE
jgi:hypothetical protein